MSEKKEIILEVKNLSKSFFGNTVLNDISFQCKKGTVLSLAGENGAGKSTLMNIISGGLVPDKGNIMFLGEKVHLRTPESARKLGIAIVHQELSLLSDLTVGENILLGKEPKKYGLLINHKKLHEIAKDVLKELQFDVSAERMVWELSPAERQMVEIAKAWINKPKILILDEPTSSLSKTEVNYLFKMIQQLKDKGVSIILITHRMEEIFQICDEVIVLKDGQIVTCEKVKEIDQTTIINAMVGREINYAFPEKRTIHQSADPLLKLENICLSNELYQINLEIPKGQIVGIGGLEGQGQRQLARGIFGINPFTSGKMIYKGQSIKINSPGDAIKNKIAFIPDDRKLEGLILPLSVRENMELSFLNELSKFSIISKKKEYAVVQKRMNHLSIKASSVEQEIEYLSGGNQQKVIFSKWISMNPDLLVLHEPTRGIDIQSKMEIYHLLRKMTGDGVSIVFFSSDMLELIGLSDVIYVMYEGRITGKLAGADATEQKIMAMSSGQK